MNVDDRESSTPAALSAALEAALLRELRQRYDWENRERFAGRMTPPVLVLSDSTTHLGRSRTAIRGVKTRWSPGGVQRSHRPMAKEIAA